MNVKIGDQTVVIATDDKAKAALVDRTGSSVEEVVARLKTDQSTAHVVRVLHPLLKEPAPIGELATLVDTDAAGVAGKIVEALTPPAPTGKAAA